jgi:hypothetical protein
MCILPHANRQRRNAGANQQAIWKSHSYSSAKSVKRAIRSRGFTTTQLLPPDYHRQRVAENAEKIEMTKNLSRASQQSGWI